MLTIVIICSQKNYRGHLHLFCDGWMGAIICICRASGLSAQRQNNYFALFSAILSLVSVFLDEIFKMRWRTICLWSWKLLYSLLWNCSNFAIKIVLVQKCLNKSFFQGLVIKKYSGIDFDYILICMFHLENIAFLNRVSSFGKLTLASEYLAASCNSASHLFEQTQESKCITLFFLFFLFHFSLSSMSLAISPRPLEDALLVPLSLQLVQMVPCVRGQSLCTYGTLQGNYGKK